jgi:predicted DNA-binding protein (MmcQ/YjbR family)
MNRQELEQFIFNTYAIKGDDPWRNYPRYEVFRHVENKKWFALLMDVDGEKLGLSRGRIYDVVNLKCDWLLASSICGGKEILPAYHMNKNNWLTAVLCEIAEDKLKLLVDMSFSLTAPKSKG